MLGDRNVAVPCAPRNAPSRHLRRAVPQRLPPTQARSAAGECQLQTRCKLTRQTGAYSLGDGEGEASEVLPPPLPLRLPLFLLEVDPVAPPVSVVRPVFFVGLSVEPDGPVPRPAPPPAVPPDWPERICSVGVPPLPLWLPVLVQETTKASVAAQTMGVRINFFIAW